MVRDVAGNGETGLGNVTVGNASDFGDLTAARTGLAATSNA